MIAYNIIISFYVKASYASLTDMWIINILCMSLTPVYFTVDNKVYQMYSLNYMKQMIR